MRTIAFPGIGRWGPLLAAILLQLLPLPAGAVPGPPGSTAPPEPAPSLPALERRIVDGPSLPDLLACASLSSPLVGAARSRWRSSVERYRVDTAWNDPEVMYEGMYMADRNGAGASPDDWLVRITQDVPLPGKVGAAGRAAEADARIGKLRTDQAARDLALAVRESYHELLYLREARRVASVNGELLEQIRKAGEGAYGAGRGGLADVLKAQAQAGQLRYEGILLEELERTERTRLNGLLSRPPDAPVGPLAEFPHHPSVYDLAEIRAFAESNLEEIRIASESVGKADSMVALSRYENLPGINLGLSGGRRDGEDQVGIQLGMTLPLWPGKNLGRTAAAAAERESVKAERDAQVNGTRATVSDAFFRYRNAERLVTLYRDDLLPQAARAMEAAETLFRQRQGSFGDYVETQAAWTSFQLSLARAKADRGKYLSRLESLAGRELTRRGEGEEGQKAGGLPEGGERP